MFDREMWRRQISGALGGFSRNPRQELQLAGAPTLLSYLLAQTLTPFLDTFQARPIDAVIALSGLARGAGADELVRRAGRVRYLTAAQLDRELRSSADLRVLAEQLLLGLQLVALVRQSLNGARAEWLSTTLERELVLFGRDFEQLRRALRDGDGRVQAEALRRLRAGGGRYTADDLQLLHAALLDEAAQTRATAARLLGVSSGLPPASLAATLLQVALRDCDAETRFAAARAIGLLRERVATPELLREVEAHLYHDDSFYRSAAALVLGQIGERAGQPELVESLAALLDDRDPYAREAAARALGRIGMPAATPHVLDALARAVQDGDLQVHEAASDSLAALGGMLLQQVAAAA